MPTNEERREVAQRLRECRGGWSSGECYYTIIHALSLPDTSRDDGARALYAALADLIEPEPERTCHKKSYATGAQHMKYFSCSECNFGWFEDINDAPFNYCPNCGAKVVEG